MLMDEVVVVMLMNEVLKSEHVIILWTTSKSLYMNVAAIMSRVLWVQVVSTVV